jgi:uncharacterized protein YktB (UPF0637 family)
VPYAGKEPTLPFSGFTDEDFNVFDIPDFSGRMSALKAGITPKLKELGDELAPRLSEEYGTLLHAHVAQHLRRSVHPSVSTWVAFAKEKRAYKPYVHLRAAITGEEFRCQIFVEDYADEKLRFGENMVRFAKPLSEYLMQRPSIHSYTIVGKNGEPLCGKALNRTALRSFGERMQKVKGQHAIFGVAWNRAHPVVQSGPQLVDALVAAAIELRPLYMLGQDRAEAAAYMKQLVG